MGLMRNAPPAVALDFVARRRRPAWPGWLVLALGLVALGYEAIALYAARQDLAEREHIVERLREQARASRPAAEPAVSPEQLAPALKVAGELNAPWARVFGDLAKARTDGLALLELHADAAGGSLRLIGQARTLEIAFDYVESLQTEGALREVRLDNHEWVVAGNADVVRFAASARWGTGR